MLNDPMIFAATIATASVLSAAVGFALSTAVSNAMDDWNARQDSDHRALIRQHCELQDYVTTLVVDREVAIEDKLKAQAESVKLRNAINAVLQLPPDPSTKGRVTPDGTIPYPTSGSSDITRILTSALGANT